MSRSHMRWGDSAKNPSVHRRMDLSFGEFNVTIDKALRGRSVWWQVKRGSENLSESKCNAIESTLYAVLFRKVKAICENDG